MPEIDTFERRVASRETTLLFLFSLVGRGGGGADKCVIPRQKRFGGEKQRVPHRNNLPKWLWKVIFSRIRTQKPAKQGLAG